MTPITNQSEMNEIDTAISQTSSSGFSGASSHLSNALGKLSDRKNPDYRNSIKESISAVESVCKQIVKDNNADLSKALKKMKGILPIHGALEQGFMRIYGWTSDEGGIRHAMMDEDHLQQEDAIFMMVSCSAFVNYLIRKFESLPS